MNSADKGVVLHCLKSMIDEAVCEECPLYGMTGTDHCEKDCVRLAINALEQEDEYVKVPKKALKYRTAGMVAYNAEWLKNHFDMERAVICGAQPCEDAISRQAVLDEAFEADTKEYGRIEVVGVDAINSLTPVTPQPKTGKWINPTTMQCMKEQVFYYCSVCGNYADANKYCPNCGSRMMQEVVKE